MLSRSQTESGPSRLFGSSKRRASASTSDVFESLSPSASTGSFSTYEESKLTSRMNSVVRTVSGSIRRQEIRAHLFGNGSELDISSPQESETEGKSALGGAARGVKNRLSRTSTIVSNLPRTRMSWSQPPTMQSRLPVNRDATIAEVEDMEQVASQIKERAFYDELAAKQLDSSVDEDSQYEAMCSPTRRRSLLTPGIATRNARDILQKPPPMPIVQPSLRSDDYFGAYAHEVLPLGRMEALDLAGRGRSSPHPRTGTPSDLSYGHLAGLKVGSLRVVNGGSTSPSPPEEDLQLQRSKTTPNLHYEDDYFTASEGRQSEEEEPRVVVPEGPGRPSSPIKDHSPRSGSPLKYQAPLEGVAVGYTVRRKSIPSQPWEPTFVTPPQCLSNADTIAGRYISELPESPHKSPSSGGNSQGSGYTRDSERSSNTSLQSLALNASNNEVTPSRPAKISVARVSRNFSGPREMPKKSSPSAEPIADEDKDCSLGCGLVRPSLSTASDPSTRSSVSKTSDSTFDSSGTIDTMSSYEKSDPTTQLGSRKLLSKSRPVSQPPSARLDVTRADRGIGQHNIPAIPQNLAARHAQRNNQYPSLDHTYPSLQHVDLKHRSSSPEIKVLPVRFPSPTPRDESGKSPKDDSISPKSKSAKKSRFSWRLRTPSGNTSSNRRASEPFDNSDFDVNGTIADFGTVSQSLGSSPYDIARDSGDTAYPPQRKSSPSISHPHQMTTANAAPRYVGMSGEEAAKMARGRSQDRTQSFQTIPAAAQSEWNHTTEKEHNQSPRSSEKKPSPNFSRRLSTQGNVKIPKKFQRPKILDTDIPPVPAMPEPAKIQKKEAEVKRASSLNCQPANATPIPRTSALYQGSTPVQDSSFLTVSPTSATSTPDWEAQRAIWAQRRKSANDGLLHRTHAPFSDLPGDESTVTPDLPKPQSSDAYKAFNPWVPALPFNPSPSPFYSVHPDPVQPSSDFATPVPAVPVHARRSSLAPPRVREPTGTPFSHDRAASQTNLSPYSNPPSHNGSTASLQASLNEDSTNVKRLSGRFEGGYGFAYEPGYGLGGSAGTRSMKTGASRKSVDVSQGFGIDLSDVPIFVAPN